MYFAYMYLMYMRTSTWVGSERLERRWENPGLKPNAMWDWIVIHQTNERTTNITVYVLWIYNVQAKSLYIGL